MNTPLLVFEVRRKRHVLLARQQARRLAGLLGYDSTEQACLAALVFQTATQALRQSSRAVLRFEMSADTLRVVPLLHEEALPLCIEKPLPPQEPPVGGAADVAFVAARLNELTPGSCFLEIEKQNEDVLRTLLELRACKAQLAELAARQAEPDAA